jgi:putative ABC transport system ATP-binding protein
LSERASSPGLERGDGFAPRDLHAEGATICLVTHDERYARDAQRTIHLFDGKIVNGQVLTAVNTEH